mmetsp:Transcript_65999/g.172951  ORF Transcript_65999/g.172951 Transcript_65999/m.172951 type:complete len:212 (-) Transcript_65999:718-1353(-)
MMYLINDGFRFLAMSAIRFCSSVKPPVEESESIFSKKSASLERLKIRSSGGSSKFTMLCDFRLRCTLLPAYFFGSLSMGTSTPLRYRLSSGSPSLASLSPSSPSELNCLSWMDCRQCAKIRRRLGCSSTSLMDLMKVPSMNSLNLSTAMVNSFLTSCESQSFSLSCTCGDLLNSASLSAKFRPVSAVAFTTCQRMVGCCGSQFMNWCTTCL